MRSKLQINYIPKPPSVYEYVHGGRGENATAFDISERAGFRIKAPRSLGLVETYLEIFTESLEFKSKIKLSFSALSGGIDVYEALIPIKELGVGLYFMRVSSKVLGAMLY